MFLNTPVAPISIALDPMSTSCWIPVMFGLFRRPNITGTVDGVFLLTSRKATGAFSSNRTQNNLGGFSTSGAGYGNFSLSAEDSNDIYSANTVQPSSIQALIMIKA